MFEGRLGVSEDVWRCLLVSLVPGVVFGFGGVSWFIWVIFEVSELLVGVLGCF